MKNISDLFEVNNPDPKLVEEVQADMKADAQTFHAENALDRIFILRLAVKEKFGKAAMYDHVFFVTPQVGHAMQTPYEMAHRSDKGLNQALTVLRTLVA